MQWRWIGGRDLGLCPLRKPFLQATSVRNFKRFTIGPGLKLRVCIEKIIFLSLNQNICCGYSKEPSQCDVSFERPFHMLKLMGKKIFTI